MQIQNQHHSSETFRGIEKLHNMMVFFFVLAITLLVMPKIMCPFSSCDDLCLGETKPMIFSYSIVWRKQHSIAFIYKINKVNFERMPKPYDTDCQEYGQSDRFQCLNECFETNYHDRFGCLPREDSLYTFIFNDIHTNFNWCNNTLLNNSTFINSNIESWCKQQCKLSCNEYSFEMDIMKTEFQLKTIPLYYIAFSNDYFTKIIYKPSLQVKDLIINLTNIWSLWHGVSFISIVIEFFTIFKKISSKINRRCGFNIELLSHVKKLFLESNLVKHIKVIYIINTFI